MAKLLIIVTFLTASTNATLSAQTPGGQDDSWQPRWEVGPYIGVARHSLVGSHLGVTRDRNHLFVGLHATAHLVRSRRWTLSYAPELLPVLLISNNPKYRDVQQADGEHFVVDDGRGPVAGFAISPIGKLMEFEMIPAVGAVCDRAFSQTAPAIQDSRMSESGGL